MALTFRSALQGLWGGGENRASSQNWVLPSQANAMNAYYPQIMSAYYGGDLGNVAPLNQQQIQSQNLAMNYADNFGQFMNPTMAAMKRALSGRVNLGAYNPVADAITQRMTQGFAEGVVPGIRRNSLAASGRPTSRMGNQTMAAAEDFERNLGQTLAGAYLPAYQDAQRNMMQGLSLSPAIAQLGMIPSSVYGDVGGQNRAYLQQLMDQPYSALSMFSGLLGNPVMQQTMNSRGDQYGGVFEKIGPSTFMSMMGGGGGG